jgi:hypothetical protein
MASLNSSMDWSIKIERSDFPHPIFSLYLDFLEVSFSNKRIDANYY